MRNLKSIARAAGFSAILAVSALPVMAHAGEAERARAAIAEARGKIDAGDKVGAGGTAGEFQSRARAALNDAEMHLAKGKKGEAISDAQHASEFADLAIVNADRRKVGEARAGRADAEATAASAQESAAAAEARAANAEQSAATANAEAEALRNAPPPAPVIVQAPAPAPTTVTTVQREVVHTPARTTVKRVVRKPAQTVAKTTTTVTTGTPQ